MLWNKPKNVQKITANFAINGKKEISYLQLSKAMVFSRHSIELRGSPSIP